MLNNLLLLKQILPEPSLQFVVPEFIQGSLCRVQKAKFMTTAHVLIDRYHDTVERASFLNQVYNFVSPL